ncbi:alpha/beta hydrolase [Helicobacter aurati]|uniref:Alpha/beta hydrolase n=1 Tax=Helicobacter aurati TaxID=137778 RepID=A0A3D8J008_9HELI|nr:alpha/beta fold hydrolase [Helicobacter aurati]RDU70859.1 alpha/beta hydrolase [Helicobacter aurati]
MNSAIKITRNIALDSDFGSVFWDLYEPLQQAIGIIQIAHGMVEHKNRYEWIGTSLAKRGYIVGISDHRGHGESISKSYLIHNDNHISWGEMEKDGINQSVQDLYKLNQELRSCFRGMKVILLGHSMGSIIARLYLFKYSQTIDTLILSGTPAPNPLINIAILLAKTLQLFGLKNRGMQLLNQLSFGGFNASLLKKLPKGNYQYTGFEWLCSDPSVVQTYINDPKCRFIFSLQSFLHLFLALRDIYTIKQHANSTSQRMPILFISGDMDACGNFGKGVEEAKNILAMQGYNNITLKLYKDSRHEILNETNKQEVLEDILVWLNLCGE